MDAKALSASPPLFAQLTAAPHRLMFCIGALNVLLAMGWWTAWLAATRFGWWTMPQPVEPAGWMHAIIMQYQVLPSFVFGFLLTTFPRWMNQRPFQRQHYIPVGVGMFGGQALTLIGLLGLPKLVHAGIVLTILGWAFGLSLLIGVLWRDRGKTWHAVSAACALTFGLCGLIAFAVFLHTANPLLLYAAIKIGGFGLLLPLFFTVCHRMIPFFASVAIPGYKAWRPMPLLAAFWAMTLAHLTLEITHAYAWLWLADLPLAAMSAYMLWRWADRRGPWLLTVLFIGFTWLPLAMGLYSVQSLWYLLGGDYHLGRGPAHALFIGYFGSLLVAMVTRVTMGHSGRPLQLGKLAAFAFVVLQAVALVRIVSDDVADAMAWQVVAGAGWLLAFLPWVVHFTRVYFSPRADGKPG
ncbi:MAG: NnrS family protein [Proteobacteria bacterium]|nr:NnrS family protein [Pseudomonadota bacterium]MBS0462242.1 NnrS family protein [Pseudomonadota bacterium]MBS0465350.1 NnrS family protein [Pseudomonadota bacterium]